VKLETTPEDDAPPKNYVELVKYIENTLGWTWPWEETDPPWKLRAAEAGKLKRVAKKGVRGKRNLTIEDLKLTVDWMRRERITVQSPVAIIYYVERALKAQADSLEVGDLEQATIDAIREVQASNLSDDEKQDWVRRLRRVAGWSVVEEWRADER
jgi:hypothetical protein